MGRRFDPTPWARAALTPDEYREIEARIPDNVVLRLMADSSSGPYMAALVGGRFDYYTHRVHSGNAYKAAMELLATVRHA